MSFVCRHHWIDCNTANDRNSVAHIAGLNEREFRMLMISIHSTKQNNQFFDLKMSALNLKQDNGAE